MRDGALVFLVALLSLSVLLFESDDSVCCELLEVVACFGAFLFGEVELFWLPSLFGK